MKKSLSLIHFVLLFLLSALLFGCNQAGVTSTGVKPSADVLRVGVSTNSPPLIYKNGSKTTGLEADFARQLASYLGKEARFVSVPWNKQIDYLEAGKTDIIMSGMSVTSKRAYRVNFTLPYLNSGQLMVTRLEDKNKFVKGIYSLMNSENIIGTVENTVGDYLITRTINKPNRKQFKKSAQAIEALKQKKIDVFVYDAPMACYYAAMNETNNLTVHLNLLSHENLAWAVSKDNQMLLDQVNFFITEKNKNGELKKTIKKWIPYM